MVDIAKIEYPADPERCQAITGNGQCINKRHPGSEYCLAHGGNKAGQAQEKVHYRNYLLGQWQARIDQKLAAPDLKNLRDEIAILRMLLEVRFSKCQEDVDLIMHTGAISDLIMKVEKVVTSCHKLETNLGQVLDKQALLNFAGRVIQIISTVLGGMENGDKLIDEIGNLILGEVGKLGNFSGDEPDA
jgi:hypothetical protein